MIREVAERMNRREGIATEEELKAERKLTLPRRLIKL
jgi:hypothetical protein